MSPPRSGAIAVPMLDDAAQEAFDRYQREKAKAAKAYQADQKAKEAKSAVLEAMGEARMARLPDGRVIQRLPRSRNMPSKPAHVQQWEDLLEFLESEQAA
jgi:hypothetical protein